MAISYAAGTSSQVLLGETIGANLDRTVATFPDRDALVVPFQDVRYTYRQLGAEVDRVARALLASGLGRGDRVGIWSPNCAEWVVLQYATAKVGVILVNINPAYRSHELAYVLEQSGCRMLVAATGVQGERLPRRWSRRCGRVWPQLERVDLSRNRDWERVHREWVTVDAAAVDRRARASSRSTIRSTSSTRAAPPGFPKGATLSHHNILNNGFFVGEGCGYTEADRVCIPVPLYHCFGMVLGNLACTTHGAAMVLPGTGLRSSRHPRGGRRRNGARACTACPRCSSPSSRSTTSPRSICRRCGRGSWPARRARSR